MSSGRGTTGWNSAVGIKSSTVPSSGEVGVATDDTVLVDAGVVGVPENTLEPVPSKPCKHNKLIFSPHTEFLWFAYFKV
jgi:hypothetical protein